MEYYINPEKYKFDIDAIFSVYIYSNWMFDDENLSKEKNYLESYLVMIIDYLIK